MPDARPGEDVTQTDWTCAGTWPFEPRYIETDAGRMHYVDEGPRDVPAVVFAHGNPTWSYLFRDLIGPLAAAGQRVVSVDHLGFGRSDIPDDPRCFTVAGQRGDSPLCSTAWRCAT